MSKNNNLHSAKNAKNDEFYTQLEVIEKEMVNYVPFFEGKIVYCNCDDYRWSNFTKCFKDNFEYLKLKNLICTNYDIGDGAWKYEYDGENETIIKLEGNGSFDNEECVNILKEADVVVTNPPFSLFRDYVKQLMDYNKKFLIIGNMNAITYKEIFPYIKNNELWFGVSIHSGDREFKVPDSYPLEAAGYRVDEEGNKYIRVKGVRWFTNISNENRNKPLDLYRKYNPTDYPKYDNYDAINVDKVTDIPEDYDGVMGVPITFLDKYCPNQFNIIGLLNSSDKELAGIEATREYDNFKEIRQDGTFTKSSGRKTKGNPVLKGKSKKGNYYIDPITNECVFSTYARIFVKKLSKRSFSANDKRIAYERQGGICPKCGEWHPIEEMEGDHIVPWWRGGKTTLDNLQMLCKKCNGVKSGKAD